MSLDTMLYIKETPWKGLGTQYETQPRNAKELVERAKLNWGVNYSPMMTEIHGEIPFYNAIYREDTSGVLGVVNKHNPLIVQNADMFNAFDYIIGSTCDVDTASSFDGGRTVFGSFKLHEQYKLFDDDIDHYFVLVNDHLKPDGKVSVLNTPVRIVCQNTLELAMSKNFYHLRVPVSSDDGINESVAQSIINSVSDAFINLKTRSEEMFNKKVDQAYMDKMMDEIFPFVKVEGESITHDKTNENIQIIRDTFLDCLDRDNLNNYRGTQYALFQAFADFDQHYYKSPDHAYDLSFRMKRLSLVGVPTEPPKTAKFLKIADKIAA